MIHELEIKCACKIETTKEPDGNYDVAWCAFEGDDIPNSLAQVIEEWWSEHAPDWANRQDAADSRDEDDCRMHAKADGER